VFLINSRYPLVCAAFLIKIPESTPSPEVTGSFCRVPSTWFSRRALVYSTCSPVSVWGTVSSPGGSPSQFEVFSWKFQPSLTMTTVATDYKDPRDYGRAVRSALSRPLLRANRRPLLKMKKVSTEMRKERVTQHDFGSHVKVLRKVSAGARSRSPACSPAGPSVRPLQSLRL